MCRLWNWADIWACKITNRDVPLVSSKYCMVGEGMRVSQFVRYSIFFFLLFGMTASGVSAAELGCLSFDSAFRVSGGFDGSPIPSGNLMLEGAIGLPEFSLALWADIDVLPSIASTFGGELKLIHEWLSISMTAQQNGSLVDITLRGQANPPGWLLYDGTPTLIAGITAIANTELLRGAGRSVIVLSPFFTGVIFAGNTAVSPSIGLDLTLDAESQLPSVAGSRLVSTINAGCVLIANTVHFTGLFDAFASLVMSINVPEWGLTVSGSLISAGADRFSYRLGVGYEWGDTYLLPVQAEKPGAICTGDVCF